jgi:hypothetical protein
MRIDAFTHILPPRYAERVFELLRARGDESASHYEGMLRSDPTLMDLDERFRFMDEIGADYRQVLVMAHTSVEHEEPDTAAEPPPSGRPRPAPGRSRDRCRALRR